MTIGAGKGAGTMVRLIRLAARLVPASERVRWTREWEAEFSYTAQQMSRAGSLGPRARVALWARALSVLGGAVRIRWEEGRAVERMIQEFRFALRTLRRSPGFTAVAVMTLALGIGANAAVFSVVNGVLIKPLPYPDAGELVEFYHAAPGIGLPRLLLTEADYLSFSEVLETASAVAIATSQDMDLTGGDGEPERVSASTVTASLFDVLRVPPALGRAFSSADNASGATPVMVLSEGLWARRFGSDPDVVGRTVLLDGVSREVVGVMPGNMTYPSEATDVWVPALIEQGGALTGHIFTGLARIEGDPPSERVVADFQAGIDNLPNVAPNTFTTGLLERGRFAPTLIPLRETLVGDVRASLWILLGTVTFVLLIACANVANLFLVRAEGGEQARAIRSALGASRADQARTYLTESGLLSGMGAVLGLVLARLGLGVILRLAPGTLPRTGEIGMDWVVVAFTGTVGVLAALVFGAIPMVRRGPRTLSMVLGEGSTSLTSTTWRHRLRSALVVTQVAVALVLLVGAGLMVRSFAEVRAVDPGFQAEGLFTAGVSLTERGYPGERDVLTFFERLVEGAGALPGVQSVSAVSRVPLGPGAGNSYGFRLEDYVPEPGEPPTRVNAKTVLPGYFSIMGIELIEGRVIEADDARALTNAIVINSTMADRFWPDESPVGRRMQHGPGGDFLTVVGVVEPVLDRSLTEPSEAMVYLPFLDTPGALTGLDRSMTLVVRTEGIPSALAGPLNQLVWSLDAQLPVANPQTMKEIVARSTVRTSFTMTILGVAAGMALLLGAVGLYGVISYVVSQRTREIGIRIALGAGVPQVRWMVLRNGMMLAAVGITTGMVGGLVMSRVLSSFLFQVQPSDPATYLVMAAILGVVTVVASYLPARRASQVDPLIAIRSD